MDSALSFFNAIASEMDDGPLCQLAVDMHRIIFLHPECPGAMVTLEGVDPLVARNNFEEVIVAALLELMEQYRREALLALQTQENVVTRSMVEQSAARVMADRLFSVGQPPDSLFIFTWAREHTYCVTCMLTSSS
ncbi:hypothetical protein GGH94_005826 [Coemansia aciculifera]|uniref:Uncharacterized protein n=1 Tax=Coemansia aciculifera TaxID=417176 RepID=A0A9W8M2Q3_9FUNG|nr:hypothetical protein GGH94_005826 [Coemansia aciculifera]